jgi:predicted DNA-binding WGR domain protein
MSAGIEVKFFGWNNDKTKNADKIWGWFKIGDKVYNFWGPRGEKKLVSVRFKEFCDSSIPDFNEVEAQEKEREKRRKGYNSVSVRIENDTLVEVEKIYPGFTDHLKKSMFIAKLSGNIMGAE